jgi:hypothetical protein
LGIHLQLGGINKAALDISQIGFAILIDLSYCYAINVFTQTLFKQGLLLIVWIIVLIPLPVRSPKRCGARRETLNAGTTVSLLLLLG